MYRIARLIIMLTREMPDNIGDCMSLNAANSRKNPENYVFFIAHMFHMFGEPDEEDPNAPWSIPTQWDFQLGLGNNAIYGAFSNPR